MIHALDGGLKRGCFSDCARPNGCVAGGCSGGRTGTRKAHSCLPHVTAGYTVECSQIVVLRPREEHQGALRRYGAGNCPHTDRLFTPILARGPAGVSCIRRRALARAASRLHVDGRQCRMAASHTLCRVSHEAVPVYCAGRALRQAQRPCRVYNRAPLPAGPLSAFCPTICTGKQRRISLAQNDSPWRIPHSDDATTVMLASLRHNHGPPRHDRHAETEDRCLIDYGRSCQSRR
jgi:hypothetical protein